MVFVYWLNESFAIGKSWVKIPELRYLNDLWKKSKQKIDN